MDAREQGRRRVLAVTAGLAAASLAGTMAVAAAAYARSDPTVDTDGTSGAEDTTPKTDTTEGAETEEWTPPPGGVSEPDPDEPPHATSGGT